MLVYGVLMAGIRWGRAVFEGKWDIGVLFESRNVPDCSCVAPDANEVSFDERQGVYTVVIGIHVSATIGFFARVRVDEVDKAVRLLVGANKVLVSHEAGAIV